MRKILSVLSVLFLVLLIAGCETTGSTSSSSGSKEYFTDVTRSDNLVVTIFTGYTFPTSKLSEDEGQLQASALILGLTKCFDESADGDKIGVGMVQANKKVKFFISLYADFKAYYVDKSIDVNEFVKRLSIETVDM